MNNPTDIKANIVANLEEAGEEGLGTLINTATTGSGSPDEIKAINLALKALVDRDLNQLAESLDKRSVQWNPLSKDESLAMLEDLRPFLEWSATEELWMRREGGRYHTRNHKRRTLP